jgi:hypothetical protein
VYNKLLHGDELLGVAEVSVSALLSNDGLTLKQWVRVMHGQHEAGQVQGGKTESQRLRFICIQR